MQRRRLVSRSFGNSRRGQSRAAVAAPRRGSVLLVVIAMLGMLLLAGLAFYTFAASEHNSSQYYKDASKVTTPSLSADRLFDFAFEQLILGPNESLTQSALWGRRHSLLASMFGRTGTGPQNWDLAPFNGQGIHVAEDPNNYTQFIDQDYDGIPDAASTPANPYGQALFDYNYSPAANNGVAPTVPTAPAPDVDYTYPDINNVWLAYNSLGTYDGSLNYSNNRVIIPSFHRPQYMRDAAGAPLANWPVNGQTTKRVFRPHPNHMTAGGGAPRFLSAPTPNVLGQMVQPFPFLNDTNGNGVADQGPYSGAGYTTYEYDVDNDGDNIKEGVWLDLDFPAQNLDDGRKFVPLFSFTVYDADGLINLNVSGNLGAATNPSLSYGNGRSIPFGNGMFISASNQGLSRSEINPQWALYAWPFSGTDYNSTTDQDNALQQYRIFWGLSTNPAVAAFSRVETANMDLLFNFWGRPNFTNFPNGSFNVPLGQYEIDEYFAGRWGELPQLQNGMRILAQGQFDSTQFPRAGQRNYDDDNDQFAGQAYAPYSYYDINLQAMTTAPIVSVPAFVHPLDFLGNGSALLSSSNPNFGAGGSANQNGLQASLLGLQVANTNPLYDPSNPIRWLQYVTGYQDPGTAAAGNQNGNTQNPNNLGVVGYNTYRDAGLVNLGTVPNTSTLLSNYNQQSLYDEPDEIVAESALASQYDAIFGIDELAALHMNNTDFTQIGGSSRVQQLTPINFQSSNYAYDIRRQFTTLSYDRTQFGFPYSVKRAWEFNADSDGDGYYEFPPVFGGAAPMANPPFYAAYPPAGSGISKQPFRSELQRLLMVELNNNNTSDRKFQYRLNMNEVLSGFTNPGPTGTPVYRPLTPHPTVGLASTQLSTLYSASTPPPFPPTDALQQEWWARYDRQIMARDIFMLLYTLGGPNDALDYTTTNAGGLLYTPPQLQQMAQFAANFVDALDRDNVITRFEYDVNPGNGWDVDDDPYTTVETAERLEVYGVEAQQLTASEWLAVRSPQLTSNHWSTRYDDSSIPASGLRYAYLELRNVSPFSVDLTNGSWRIRRQFQTAASPDVWLTITDGVTGAINAGGQYVIGTSDNNEGGGYSADFRVDYDMDGNYDLIAPRRNPDLNPTSTAAPGTPNSDLDLVHASNLGRFVLRDQPSVGTTNVGVGGFLNAGMEGLDGVNIIIERRVHPYRAAPTTVSEELDNPFVEVDRMEIPSSAAIKKFSLTNSDTTTEITTSPDRLPGLESYERREPLNRLTEQVHPPAVAPSVWANSIGYRVGGGAILKNDTSPMVFTLWQPHFDRDFSSTYDLLSLPLYGPDGVTHYLYDGGLSVATNQPAGTIGTTGHHKFLRPGDPNPANANASTDNRWYRILEFLTVPTQTHLALQNQNLLQGPRLPGAINLNTVRQRGVLAGLLDDPDNPNTAQLEGHFNPNYAVDAYNAGLGMLQDQFENRDWWAQFVAARDQYDPVTGYYLPGLPNSRPFRSFTYLDNQSASIENTLLRHLPMDGGQSWMQQRQLFEARTVNDINTPFVDYHTRHRLLRKAGNNATTRSNVFIVFASVQYFEAVGGNGTPVQIGAPLQGTTGHRGFFVIDRSLPEQAYNPASQYNATLPTFDWRKMVPYRKVIQ